MKWGLSSIGPSGAVMDTMGDTDFNAREQMIKAGVPVVPGSDGEVHTAEGPCSYRKIGYQSCLRHRQVVVERGIRKVEKAEDLVAAFETASSEAKANLEMALCILNV